MPSVASKNKGKASRDRRSRSRNTTPVSSIANIDSPTPHYLQNTLLTFPSSQNLEDVLGTSQNIPSASSLSTMLDQIKALEKSVTAKGEKFDLIMRELAKKQRDREAEEHENKREKERAAQDAERRKEKADKTKRGSPMVIPKKREREEERPPAVGAHGLARQDGGAVDHDASSDISSPPAHASNPPSEGDSAEPHAKSPASRDSSAEPHQPAPAPAVAQYHLFGEDPNDFPDDTVYQIRQVTPNMTDEEKMEIYHVKSFPHDDLVALTAGVPPDKDFSQGKENKQTVSAQQFANFVEPFIRPLTEEDAAFLKERQDRVGVMEVPPKGRRHYKDIWNEEDGQMQTNDIFSSDLPPNQARGSMDDLDDLTAESDQVSNGPVANRLMQLLRVNPRSGSNNNTESNGDTTMTNGVTNGEHEDEPATNGDASHQPATFLPDTRTEAWKNAPAQFLPDPNLELDSRILGELRWLSMFNDDAAVTEGNKLPPYDNSEDDEVAARLRFLHSELRRIGVVNGARKTRVLELCEERQAMQEYMTITEDLDSQLNQAYLKRNRNLGKGKKHNVKKPGVPGVAEPLGRTATMGEPIRNLLERSEKWVQWIGPTVEYGLGKIPKRTVFDPKVIDALEKREREEWERAAEDALEV